MTPLEFIASGTADCAVSLRGDVVTDKDGEEVPEGDLGPYAFGIAPLGVVETDPADTTVGVDPAAPISIVPTTRPS